MKKQRLFSVPVLMMLFALSPVNAQITISPTGYNFGEVEVGSSASADFTLSNLWWGDLTILNIQLVQAGADFILVTPPPGGTVIHPGSSCHFGVVFSPSAEGLATAVVELRWANGETGISTSEISGVGVTTQPPPVSMLEIISFFDISVANGTLMGTGSGNSAEGRLNALRNMLFQASNQIDAGDYEVACDQLNAALMRCDDFVVGTARNDLKQMISDVMFGLGC